MENFVSDISGESFPVSQRVAATTLRNTIFRLIKADHPTFSKASYLADHELAVYKEKHIAALLKRELGELSELDQKVIQSLKENKVISAPVDVDAQETSFGEHIADKVAEFGGSWTFIISFVVFLLVWIFANVYWLSNKGFDPYPFILLNLILSCVAALQAPIIMMSQNRQEDKDRQRAKNDYMVNLKAELEIRALHEKIDHLIIQKEQEVVELQGNQLDLIRDLLAKIERVEETLNCKK